MLCQEDHGYRLRTNTEQHRQAISSMIQKTLVATPAHAKHEFHFIERLVYDTDANSHCI